MGTQPPTPQTDVNHAYIHVPFCRSRCHYCDFYFELEKHGGVPRYVDQLIREIFARATMLSSANGALTSIYFGGGTPSLLSAQHVSRILQAFQTTYSIANGCEITLELNPEDTSRNAIEGYLTAGITRFSVGVQSLDDAVLKKVARRHSAAVATECIQLIDALMGPSSNISIDLMYGLPFQTLESWQDSLQRAVALPIQHISLYGLQLEAGTALEKLHKKAPQHYPLPEDTTHLACYDYARHHLGEFGFAWYEVSNAARAGFESQHNMAYWQQKNYLAFGPGAHGLMYPHRYTVVENLEAYNRFETVSEITETQLTTPWEHLENLFIFGLRTTNGVSWQTLRNACTPETSPFEALERYVASVMETQPLLVPTETGIRLLPEGIPQMNTLLTHFIQLEDELNTLQGG
jgi:oxygen-independent coproporphyrinogen III oxidase